MEEKKSIVCEQIPSIKKFVFESSFVQVYILCFIHEQFQEWVDSV